MTEYPMNVTYGFPKKKYIKINPRSLFQVKDGPITYHFRNKRSAKKHRDKFPVLKKQVEFGPDHWRYEK